MAKHDQRILKFLNQNADRAPTITDMMTRLSISISDISDSLVSLQGQGLISMKTNNQGIECWYPALPQAASPQATPLSAPYTPASPSTPVFSMDFPAVEPRNNAETRSGFENRFGGGTFERPAPALDPQPPMPKQPPVHVQHIPMSEAAPSAPAYDPALSPSVASPLYGLSQPAPKSVGMVTFALGLIVAVAVSSWLGGRMAAKEIKKSSLTFVDKKTLLEATTAFNAFQETTKSQVAGLEAEIKKLKTDLVASKAAMDSLATTASPAASKAELAKAKTAKKATTAKTKAASKAAARVAAKKKKSQAARASRSESSDSPSEMSSSYSDPLPSVPEAPGLDDQDLPPPPE